MWHQLIQPMTLENSEYNSLIFLLIVSPSKIVMTHHNGTKIEHNSKLTMKLGPLTLQDITLQVRCIVYGAKPAATITWEYNGRKLDSKSNPAHCYSLGDPDHSCIASMIERSEKNDSLWTTEAVAIVTVGRKNLNKLRCSAHNPALQYRNMDMHSEVTLEMEKKGKFKLQ